MDNVSLNIEAGEFSTLLGPSGCGKTTILRMIAGFDLPDAGKILLDGKDLADTPAETRPVHTVFQSHALFPHMTVAQNVAFPLRMAQRPAEKIAAMASETLEQVNLADKANAYPHELSGGQKQRVALARGLVNRPRLLLLDEPLGALDAKLREKMQIDLINLQRDVGITFVFVTHAQVEALALSHRIAVMDQGRIVSALLFRWQRPHNRLKYSSIIHSPPRNRKMSHNCSSSLTPDRRYPFDARGIAKRFRQAAIFGAFESLNAGETMLFINDQDPLPLIEQFKDRYGDFVEVNYLSREPREIVIEVSLM